MVIFVVGMRASHRVCGERGEVVSAVVTAVTVIGVVTRRAPMMRVMGSQGTAVALDLRGSRGEEVELAVVGAPTETSIIRVEVRGDDAGVGSEGVRGGDIG
jgi:hypothetical protein